MLQDRSQQIWEESNRVLSESGLDEAIAFLIAEKKIIQDEYNRILLNIYFKLSSFKQAQQNYKEALELTKLALSIEPMEPTLVEQLNRLETYIREDE
jgi:tetratricopeptide (TPR) repeat protein